MTPHDLAHDPAPIVVRQLELITDVGGRQGRDHAEALAPGATAPEVGRRHGLRP
ncbi:MAG: hypothetical protein ACOY5Y_11980 [Pseudomonadota bacterium]